MTIWILIADNHETARAGIRLILANAPDIKVVGEAKNGVEVLQLVAELQPDVLLLALEISRPCPVEITEWVRANYDTAVLVLTAYDHDGCLAMMVGAGVAGYLTKHEVAHWLPRTIRAAHSGQCLVTREQWARIENWRATVGKRLDSLTRRERQVLHQIAQGHDNRTIASNLDISHRTVEYHITHLLGKLHLRSRLEAATWFKRHEPPVPLK